MRKTHVLLIEILFYLLNALVTLGFILRKEYSYLVNPALTTATYVGIIGLKKSTTFPLENYIRISLMITLACHTVIGEYFYAYERIPVFDITLHVFGTFSFALYTYALLNHLIQIDSPYPEFTALIVTTLLGIGLGTLFELGEFFGDLLFNSHNQQGLLDTNLDLLFDLLGSVIAGYLAMKRTPQV